MGGGKRLTVRFGGKRIRNRFLDCNKFLESTFCFPFVKTMDATIRQDFRY